MEKIQEKELDDLLDEASSLGDSEEDQAKAQYIEYEYQSRDGGLSRLESQRDALNEKSDQKKYFFDEAALSAQFSDINTDLLIFLIFSDHCFRNRGRGHRKRDVFSSQYD